MSRSYRKPHQYACTTKSHRDDKQTANRAWRRLTNQSLHVCEDFEEYLIPHQYESSGNDRWCWAGDGNGWLVEFPSDRASTDLGITGDVVRYEERRQMFLNNKRK